MFSEVARLSEFISLSRWGRSGARRSGDSSVTSPQPRHGEAKIELEHTFPIELIDMGAAIGAGVLVGFGAPPARDRSWMVFV